MVFVVQLTEQLFQFRQLLIFVVLGSLQLLQVLTRGYGHVLVKMKDQVLVAMEEESAARTIVDEAIADNVPNSVEVHRGAVCAIPSVEMVYLAVLDEIPCGQEFQPVAAAKRYRARADIVYILNP